MPTAFVVRDEVPSFCNQFLAGPCKEKLYRAALRLIDHEGGLACRTSSWSTKAATNVGVTVVDIAAGERAQGIFMDDDSAIEVEARQAVPLGHKIAIVQLPTGAAVLEYGIPIGKTTRELEPGTYVHTHNLRSARW